MDFKKLNRDNFILYAMGNYSNPDCLGVSEFTEDLARIKYVKRLLKRYQRTNKIRTILLLNHVVVLGNVFGCTPASRMLFYKLERNIHSPLKTVLLYLNYIKDNMMFDELWIEEIPLDTRLGKILQEL